MRIITLDSNNKIISIKNVGNSYVLETNDIETNLGEMGQVMQSDGSFLDDTTPIIPPIIQPTNQEISDRLTNIEDSQDLMLLKLEAVIV